MMRRFYQGHKKSPVVNYEAQRIWQLPTLPHCGAVPSAMRGLTSLFGMGRGEHPRQNHHKSFAGLTSPETCYQDQEIRSYWEMLVSIQNLSVTTEVLADNKKIKAYGQLVLLGFSVTTFTPVAYQRHSL